MNSNGWAKTKKAARYAGVSERTFRTWLKKGLPHSRLPSGTILTCYKNIDHYLERYTVDENTIDKLADEIFNAIGK